MGRFTTCDPLFEKYYGWSPYVYSANNPVNLYDNNGKWWSWHHADLSESAAKGMGFTNRQISYLKQGSMVVDKWQKPEEQYLHCMVSPEDITACGSYKNAVKVGKEKLQARYDRLKQLFIETDGDEAFYYLGQILHSIQDALCPEHQWKIYQEEDAGRHSYYEGFEAAFNYKEYKDSENASQEEIIKLIKEKGAEIRRNSIGTEIGDIEKFWFLGPSGVK